MKADPADQLLVIELARLDALIRSADHARTHPAQTARVNELLAKRQSESAVLTGLLGDLDDVRAELTRLESDVSLVEARIARDTERLAATSNVKEAQGLEHELASLAARRSSLEDVELELMERVENAEAAVAAQQAAIAAINDEGARVSAEGKVAVAAATATFEASTRDRAAVAARVPGDLLALYDRIAARGTGAGLLTRKTCEACRMVLSGTDLNVVRAAFDDDVLTCPECGAILVRTDESGL